MFKFFWRLREPEAETTGDWRHDPTRHPALRAMSLKELGDLPMVAEVPRRVIADRVLARCNQPDAPFRDDRKLAG